MELSVRMVSQYATHGETKDLQDIGYKVCKLYPRLWELGQAMQEAKHTLRNQWEAERLAKAQDE